MEICGGEEEWSKCCRQKVYEARIQTLYISGRRERQRKERGLEQGRKEGMSEEGRKKGRVCEERGLGREGRRG